MAISDALATFASNLPGKLRKAGVGAHALCLPALTGSADAFLALALTRGAKSGRVVLAIVPGIPDADRLADDLRSLTQRKNLGEDVYRTRVLEFPPLLGDDKSSLGVRLKTLAALKAWAISPYPCVVVTSFPALATPLPKDTGDPIRLTTAANARQTLGALSEALAAHGYRRVPMVEAEGDFSVRGGILDAWSPGDEFPVRAEFFGEDLESLRTFDPATQLSVDRIETVELLNVTSTAAEDASLAESDTLLDRLPPDAALLAIDHNAYTLDLVRRSPDMTIVYTGDPAPQGVPTADFPTSPLPGFAELGADEAHHPELFEAARKRLDQHLAAAEQRNIEILRIDDLSGGFETPNLIVVTKADRVFTKRKAHLTRASHNENAGARLTDFDHLEPGEYVVHIDYGVGRYVGSSEIMMDGKRNEVFTIEYADGALLHVPAAHAHLLSRYVGIKGESVKLHRLDGQRWAKDKQDAQKAVADLASALLSTQAKREMVPGFAYDVHCEGREAFDAAFPYEETPDQLSAIAAIEADLSRPKPMDRLICGDAGYGKTEVAMRAAYIAALNGKQVAVLAPTTVLAEQHFETFTSRFDGTPVRIESVSRFQSAETHKGTFQRLATGACDIVIGTHAILSSKICFHDLGLIIVDEEQRFGVRHKEFLKSLRATADVLTMSATPIPRTLYLSMTGARDLSLLRTPPRERVAVETRIVRDSDDLIRMAIESELSRGGQVFFLHNRVLSIHTVEKRLKALCPRARIIVAHGQMDSATLAHKMRDFEGGKYDILLSTTIIESGIDIPRANTILIDKADTFGMADLYQLRGRVGRSSRQGYAYFLLPASGVVDSDARERLDALKRHGGLGSGFNLAVRDLELRGAGNLLGRQQSGHIAAVGFGLYCQLLQRTIALMKGEKPKEIVDVQINLDFVNAQLPCSYIAEETLRLNMLRRFAEAQDARVIKALTAELVDRFGPLPPEAEDYVRVAELRVACALADIGHLDVKGTRAVFYKVGSREIAYVGELRGKTAKQKFTELVRMTRSR